MLIFHFKNTNFFLPLPPSDPQFKESPQPVMPKRKLTFQGNGGRKWGGWNQGYQEEDGEACESGQES